MAGDKVVDGTGVSSDPLAVPGGAVGVVADVVVVGLGPLEEAARFLFRVEGEGGLISSSAARPELLACLWCGCGLGSSGS